MYTVSNSPAIFLIFLIFALDGTEALLGTYNFHQPVQLNRLFKSDPRHQMALIENGGGIRDDISPSYYYQREPSQSPVIPSELAERIPFNSNLQEPGLSGNLKPITSLNSLDLYEKMFPIYRRMA